MSDLVDASAVADEIVRRLANNELPVRIAEGIKKFTKHGNWYGSAPLFSGYDQLMLDYQGHPDGSITLILADYSRQPFWRTTLRPPAAVETVEMMA